MIMRRIGIVAIAVVLLFVFAACSQPVGETYVPEVDTRLPIISVDLTNLLALPSDGGALQTSISSTAFTGSVMWMFANNLDEWLSGTRHLAVGSFNSGNFYEAMITLNAGEEYSFTRLVAGGVSHEYGYAENPIVGVGGSRLVVSVQFPSVARRNDRPVTMTNLAVALPPPVRFGSPADTFSFPGQFSGTVIWTDVNGNPLEDSHIFIPGSVYRAIATINPVIGRTLAGLNAHTGFTHTGGTIESIDLVTRTVVIRFRATAQVFEDHTVNFLNLSTIEVPWLGSVPSASLAALNASQTQFVAENIEWFYVDGNEPIANLEEGRPFFAVIDLTAAEGYTFDGFSAGAFFHNHEIADRTEFDADSGQVTVFFNEAVCSKIFHLTFTETDLDVHLGRAVPHGILPEQFIPGTNGGRALVFPNQPNRFIEVTSEDGSPLLLGLEELTATFWVQRRGTGASWFFFAARNANQMGPPEFYLGDRVHARQFTAERFYSGRAAPMSASINTGANSFADNFNTWHHVAVVQRRDNVQVFMDGTLRSSANVTQPIAEILGPNPVLFIGRATWGANGEWANGVIQDYRIFRTALPAGQIAEIFAAGAQ